MLMEQHRTTTEAIGAHDLDAAPLHILANLVGLILGRVLLVLRRQRTYSVAQSKATRSGVSKTAVKLLANACPLGQ